MQIKEFAELTGVSVRTLHYYDEIGLLKPSEVDAQTGYRFYDENSFERMQEILFYRELDFSLKTIAEILSSPDYDKQQALSRQRKLLLAKKERLEQLIMAIDSVEKGEGFMKSKNEYEVLKSQYAEEAKQRWGNTAAYKEFEQRHTDHSQAAALLDAVFEEFAELNHAGVSPDSEPAKNHGRRITAVYYRQLLHLHRRHSQRLGTDVCHRRPLPEKYRPARRRHSGVCLGVYQVLL